MITFTVIQENPNNQETATCNLYSSLCLSWGQESHLAPCNVHLDLQANWHDFEQLGSCCSCWIFSKRVIFAAAESGLSDSSSGHKLAHFQRNSKMKTDLMCSAIDYFDWCSILQWQMAGEADDQNHPWLEGGTGSSCQEIPRTSCLQGSIFMRNCHESLITFQLSFTILSYPRHPMASLHLPPSSIFHFRTSHRLQSAALTMWSWCPRRPNKRCLRRLSATKAFGKFVDRVVTGCLLCEHGQLRVDWCWLSVPLWTMDHHPQT